jgi:hypothetical protein
MEAICTSETSVEIQLTTRRYVADDCTLGVEMSAEEGVQGEGSGRFHHPPSGIENIHWRPIQCWWHLTGMRSKYFKNSIT